MATYSGNEAPQQPITTSGQQQIDPAVFAEQMSNYDLDQKSYDRYKTAYQDRLQNTPMYAQSQFQTTQQPVAKTVADLYKMYLGRDPEAGIVGSAAASTRPNFIQEAQNELDSRPGFGNQNLMNASGSYYGNQLRNPIYRPMPVLPTLPIDGGTGIDDGVSDGGDGGDGFDGTGGGGGNKQTSPEDDPGEGFNPSMETAKEVMDFGERMSSYPVAAPLGLGAKVLGSLATKYGSYMVDVAGRQAADAASSQHAKDTAAAAAEGKNVGFSGAQFGEGGSVYSLADKYAQGGPVKTHYQTAGRVKLPSGYENVEQEEAFGYSKPVVEAVTSPVKGRGEATVLYNIPGVDEDVRVPGVTYTNANPVPAQTASEPVVADVVPKAVLPGNERMVNLQAMLDMYGPKHSAYAADLRTARASAKAENEAFARMLATSMGSPEDEQSSKAEIYFRLAAAFGAPTKTGQFSENLGLVGKELGDYAKGKRATAREQRLLNLELQKLKVGSAKEELDTLRTMSAEEMKDKRAVATELIKDYIRSGEPQSSAGKQALDEGLKAGTPAYQARVAEIGNLNVERQMAQIAASLAGVQTAAANLSVAQTNAELARQKFENAKTQQAKLSPAEVKLKVDAEDTLAQTDQALANLKKAYALNPNTFDGSVLDVTQRKLYEAAGSKDPKVVATRELENLLKKASLSQLKATFPGAISNDERAALDAVQGLEAKSKDERAVIMKNAFTALKSVSERHRRRLSEINQGVYRDTTPIDEGDK
jgi:hypothetical protein